MNKSLVGISAFFFAVAIIAFQYCCSVPSSQLFVLVSLESASDSSHYYSETSELNGQVDSVLLLKKLLPFLPVDHTPRIAKSVDAEAKKVEKNDELSTGIDSYYSSYPIKIVDFVFSRSFSITENDVVYLLFDFYTPYRGPPSFFAL